MPTLEIHDTYGIEIHDVCGVEIRAIDVMPEEFIGVDNGQYLTIFWEGAEIARIMPHYSEMSYRPCGPEEI